MTDSSSLLTKRQAAAYIDTTERTLDRYQFRSTNPVPFIALSRRSIRFRLEEIERERSEEAVGAALGQGLQAQPEGNPSEEIDHRNDDFAY